MLSRLSQLVTWEPVLRALTPRHEAILVLDRTLEDSPKDDQAPRRARLPDRIFLFAEVLESFGGALAAFLAGLQADWIVWTYVPGLSAAGLRETSKSRLGHLQASWSDLMMLGMGATPTGPSWPPRGPQAGNFEALPDRIWGWGASWPRWWGEFSGLAGPERASAQADLARRFLVVGHPHLDHLAWIDREGARKALDAHLPERYVLYLPFPRRIVPTGWWSHGLYAGPWPWAQERWVARNLARWAHDRGWGFVAKVRGKEGVVPSWLLRTADRLVGDRPGEATMIELLAGGAALLVHHCSATAAEAWGAGIPAASVVPPWPSAWPPYAARLSHPAFVPSFLPGFYGWPLPGGHGLPPTRLDDPWAVAADVGEYRQRFLTPDSGPGVGARIVKDMETFHA